MTTTETTDLARRFLDEMDQLGDIPGEGTLEPGRMNWLHGTKAGGAKTPGVFYIKSTELGDVPGAPWKADNERFDKETGYSAARVHLAVIGWRSQWFIPSKEEGKLPTWLLDYQEDVGAQKLTEFLCLAEGIDDPLVLSVKGKNKAQPVLDALRDYERGLLKQASRMAKRALPRWAFWLPFQNQLDPTGKTAYLEATDGAGTKYGSIVTPPTLYLPADAINTLYVGNDLIRRGAELRNDYADWFKVKRLPQGVTEGEYVIEERPALPAPAVHRNVPQTINPDEDLPF